MSGHNESCGCGNAERHAAVIEVANIVMRAAAEAVDSRGKKLNADDSVEALINVVADIISNLHTGEERIRRLQMCEIFFRERYVN